MLKLTTGVIMSELLIAKGKLADLQKQYDEIDMKAESMFIQIRELLSPHTEFIELQLDKILILVKEFRDMQINARNLLHQINKIKSVYNL